MLTLDALAAHEVHDGQIRAVLEHLDVACSRVVCSWCRQFDSANHAEMNRQEYSEKCELCAKKSSGNCIRCVLTLNLPAHVEVHAGQVRAIPEHLDVACSYVVRSYWKQRERSGQERSNKGCGLVRKENSGKFLQRLTFQAVDAAQVDARHVRDVRQVLRQSELAAVGQVDLASVGADVADHADDGAGEDTWNTREGTFRKKVRTGAQSSERSSYLERRCS